MTLYDTTKTVDCWRTILDQDPVLNNKDPGFKIMTDHCALIAKEHIILLARDRRNVFMIEIKE